MSEHKHLKSLRPMIAAAICLAVMVCSAFAADAATGGAFFRSIQTVFGVQEVRQEVFQTSDFDATVWTELTTGEDLPEDAVSSVNLGRNAGAYLTEDGRVMLREKGGEDRDVTEEWAKGGTVAAGGEEFTVEVFTDGAGNVLYQCSITGEQEADVDKVFLSGGMLFDPDKFDLNDLPMFEESVDFVEYGEADVSENREKPGVYAFTFREPEE